MSLLHRVNRDRFANLAASHLDDENCVASVAQVWATTV